MMNSIVVIGWKSGFDKIGMNKLLRDRLGYSLGDAKRMVDAILENKETPLTLAPESLEQITIELAKVGAVFKIQPA